MSVRVVTAASAVALAALAAACRSAPSAEERPAPSAAGLAAGFTAQFDRSAADWNRGDLDGFMADYARDSLTGFVSEGRVQRGYDWIRKRYAPLFGPGAQRDSLRFDGVAARPLGAEFALVTARYLLHRGGATISSGPFTLVMQRQPDGWKILHDHTSSDPR
ncbi:MAG: YybH family protein [Gemmatimonadales bacterium]